MVFSARCEPHTSLTATKTASADDAASWEVSKAQERLSADVVQLEHSWNASGPDQPPCLVDLCRC